MASPQLEAGYTAVAHDLWVALDQYDFTALERRIVNAVIYMSWGVGKKQSLITAEDIRYYLGAPRKLRTDRIEEAITILVGLKILNRQILSSGPMLGLQKDYDQWCDKMSHPLQEVNKSLNTTTSIGSDKMSPIQRLLDYAQAASKFTYGLGAYRAEQKRARLLYQDVLAKTHSGSEAFNLICDYIDENEWMRKNVRMQFTFMASRFEAWRSQIPRKPRDVKDDEEALGKHYRYDVSNKHWLPTEHREEGLSAISHSPRDIASSDGTHS